MDSDDHSRGNLRRCLTAFQVLYVGLLALTLIFGFVDTPMSETEPLPELSLRQRPTQLILVLLYVASLTATLILCTYYKLTVPWFRKTDDSIAAQRVNLVGCTSMLFMLGHTVLDFRDAELLWATVLGCLHLCLLTLGFVYSLWTTRQGCLLGFSISWSMVLL